MISATSAESPSHKVIDPADHESPLYPEWLLMRASQYTSKNKRYEETIVPSETSSTLLNNLQTSFGACLQERDFQNFQSRSYFGSSEIPLNLAA